MLVLHDNRFSIPDDLILHEVFPLCYEGKEEVQSFLKRLWDALNHDSWVRSVASTLFFSFFAFPIIFVFINNKWNLFQPRNFTLKNMKFE